jgi:hypothetical protein
MVSFLRPTSASAPTAPCPQVIDGKHHPASLPVPASRVCSREQRPAAVPGPVIKRYLGIYPFERQALRDRQLHSSRHVPTDSSAKLADLSGRGTRAADMGATGGNVQIAVISLFGVLISYQDDGKDVR